MFPSTSSSRSIYLEPLAPRLASQYIRVTIDSTPGVKYIGVSKNSGKTPKWMVKIMENPITHYFWISTHMGFPGRSPGLANSPGGNNTDDLPCSFVTGTRHRHVIRLSLLGPLVVAGYLGQPGHKLKGLLGGSSQDLYVVNSHG